MAAHSRGHICHCLGRIEAVRRDSPVAISGLRRRTGGELVKGVRSLARGLADSGVARGDVVAVAALNRYSTALSIELLQFDYFDTQWRLFLSERQ